MIDDPVLPIAERPHAAPRLVAKPSGRLADLIAASLAGLGAALSLIVAAWFFLGFAENDTRPEHLASALVLTTGLFSFAISPFAISAYLAWRAHRSGATRRGLFWVLFLMLPWIALGAVAATLTPLPIWSGVLMASLATILSLWAITSIILDWRLSRTTK
jgi:hypothetical protein